MKLYSTDPNLPHFARAEYVAREPDLTLIADEIGGTRAMHDRSTTYIRKWTAEKKANYDIRRKCETFFEGLGRTLSAAVGMLFAKAPSLEWNQSEELMTAHWDNLDGAGTAGPVFVKRFAEAALRDGLSLILVDHPSPPPGTEVVTGDVETAFNLRPMWRRYDRAYVINWLVEIVDNVATLTQLTLVEPATVRVGAFGTKSVIRYRDLRLVPVRNQDGTTSRVATWTLRQLNETNGSSSGSFTQIGNGVFQNRAGDGRNTLPIAIAYTGRTDAPMESVVPLMGVAWANLAHWQLSTSLRFNSEVAGFAQPVVIGSLTPTVTATGETIPGALGIGPLVSVQLEENGDFKWVEPEGTGLERLALLVLEKLRQIAALGVSFLMSDTRAAETAEAKRLDAAAENATLATAAQGIEDGVNTALEIHAWYLGIEKANAPVIAISRDFESTALDAPTMLAYVTAVAQAGLPIRILLEAWKQGGRLPADANLDQIEADMQAQMAAAEKQAALDAALRAEQLKLGAGGNGSNAPPTGSNGGGGRIPPAIAAASK